MFVCVCVCVSVCVCVCVVCVSVYLDAGSSGGVADGQYRDVLCSV